MARASQGGGANNMHPLTWGAGGINGKYPKNLLSLSRKSNDPPKKQ